MIKSIIITFAIVALTACPDSKNNQDVQIPRVGTFEATTNGEWVSACQDAHVRGRDRDRGRNHDFDRGQPGRELSGSFTEKLTFSNGTGTRQIQFYDDRSCTGRITRATAIRQFTYVVNSADGAVSQVTMTYQNQVPEQVNIISNSVTLSITSPNGTIAEYNRINAAVGNDDFEHYALGTWETLNCYRGRNFTSYRQVINIDGYGEGSFYNRVFQGRGCQGQPQTAVAVDFTYYINNFSGGIGTITVDTVTKNISFQRDEMSWGSGINSILYIKANR